MKEVALFTLLCIRYNKEHFSSLCLNLRALPDTYFRLIDRENQRFVVLTELTNDYQINEWIEQAQSLPGVTSISTISPNADKYSMAHASLHETV